MFDSNYHLRRLAITAAAALAILSAGCSGANGVFEPAPGTLVRVDPNIEVPASASTFSFSVTISNTTRGNLMLDGMARDFVRLEQLLDGSWREVFAPTYTLALVDPVMLPPGESITRTISVPAVPGDFHHGASLPGVFRAHFLFGQEARPHTVRAVTNEFEVRVADADQ